MRVPIISAVFSPVPSKSKLKFEINYRREKWTFKQCSSALHLEINYSRFNLSTPYFVSIGFAHGVLSCRFVRQQSPCKRCRQNNNAPDNFNRRVLFRILRKTFFVRRPVFGVFVNLIQYCRRLRACRRYRFRSIFRSRLCFLVYYDERTGKSSFLFGAVQLVPHNIITVRPEYSGQSRD